MLGIEALINVRKDQHVRVDHEEWARGLGERSAGDFFLRVYARYEEGLVRELTREEWAEYKAAGGRTYDGGDVQQDEGPAAH